ncbi:Part of AAA domain-containing protein [Streptomyces sp. Ncost-T6T-1]|uniref:DEAD/DEAH box helicase n=1 Tax=Streptomyces sp. Ncost-T6T-1 TaxID=1100828 RepID=UPI000805ACB4|nr:DEAD/DEAH box helicase [Streptomyces sp. Ncost-T6T-1]SBV05539.1 Part of AAA domain-containing protein [Streptomyces sp. Ncost-T6T-1]
MTAGGERRRRADVVRYWRAVEMFSPQKVEPVSRPKDMYPVESGAPLPWEEGHPVRRRSPARNMVRQHTVYCGVYPVAAVRDVLLDVFGGSEEDHDGRVNGDSALLAFEVTDEGLLVQDSLVFSACGWAVGRSRKPGPGARGWLDGFDEAAAACERVVLGVGDGELRIVDAAPGVRSRPFAGLVCEIAMGAVGGALSATLGPVLGDLAAGALSGAADAVSGGRAADPEPGRGRPDADGGTDDTGGEAPPRLGDKPLTVRDLSAVTRWVTEHFGVGDDLRPEAIRVQTRTVARRKAGRSGGTDFLNSFIAADLSLVSDRLGTEEPGAALRDYLTASTALVGRTRVDLRENPDAVLSGVQPVHLPLARWPAKTEHPLVLSQQFAVNRIVEQLADRDGLYAVNGPPGTGKTTQLRDLIAAVLVMRAEALSGLGRPEDAFSSPAHRWNTGTYQRSVAPLKPELTGYEMVIASANNGAVENISTEIPALDSVAEEWREEAAFFPEQGRLILDGAPAWGTIAAKLGNKGNRSEFRSRYWFGPPREERAERGEGMRDVLRAAAKRPGGQAAWRQSVTRFREARRQVLALRDERQSACEALRGYTEAGASVAAARRTVGTAEEDLAVLAEPAREARAARDRAQDALAGPADRRAEHRRHRPGLVAGLFTLGAAQRDWQAEDRLLADAEQRARTVLEERVREAAGFDRAEGECRRALDEARRALNTAESHHARLREQLRDARERWGPHLPGDENLDGRTREEARELSSPWSDPEFTRARTRLFLAAMDLHRAFIEGAADRMRKNLDAAMDVLCGEAPRTLEPELVQAAWQSLFLALPVVSTTFASLDRMFTGLGPRSLGWMLIDEAGQATAQMPVGALWRARRGVIVGDPLQLEPVVTLPHTGQQALRRTFGVAEEWEPSRTSAQRVADRLNTYGTWLPAPQGAEENRVWVGSPLRVHRRCDDPMFTISNDIAYDGLMVHGVHRTDDYAVARRSVWWPVSGGRASQGKWSSDEGECANVIVHRLVSQGLNPAQGLFVISPFRDVVTGLRRHLCSVVPRDRVGTVHTTQGKESDVVLLVLGAGGDRSGPRSWAASAPNLLNVAVSRARRRLFVVGDHEAWRGLPYFDVMAGQLPCLTEDQQMAMRDLAPARLPEGCRCRQ